MTGQIVNCVTERLMHPLWGSNNPPSGTTVVIHNDEGDKPSTRFTLTSERQIRHATSGLVVMDIPNFGWQLRTSPIQE